MIGIEWMINNMVKEYGSVVIEILIMIGLWMV